jgi:hydroxypyruvate reductase
VSRSILEAIGRDGHLVNVARGSVVDEQALCAALRDGTIAGAGLDVFEDEPHVPAELLTLDNVALTPHIGGNTAQAREAMATLLIANVNAFFAGEPLVTPVR